MSWPSWDTVVIALAALVLLIAAWDEYLKSGGGRGPGPGGMRG